MILEVSSEYLYFSFIIFSPYLALFYLALPYFTLPYLVYRITAGTTVAIIAITKITSNHSRV